MSSVDNTVFKDNSIPKKYKKHSQSAQILYRLSKNKGAMLGLIILILMILIALMGNFLFDYSTDVIGQNIPQRLQKPSTNHFFGTDQYGRDIFSRVMYGTKYSLSIGFSAVAISLILGVLFGAVAGYYEGKLGEVIMRTNDIIGSIPYVLLAVVIVSALGRSLFNLILAIGLSSVPKFVRITRATVLTVRNEEFIESAKAIGLPSGLIIVKHILPNALSPIIVQTTLHIASAIVSASSLSYLGLGVQAPTPEWGSMLSEGRAFLLDYSYMCFFPGLAIMFTVLALNMLGDGLRDAMDPKLKK